MTIEDEINLSCHNQCVWKAKKFIRKKCILCDKLCYFNSNKIYLRILQLGELFTEKCADILSSNPFKMLLKIFPKKRNLAQISLLFLKNDIFPFFLLSCFAFPTSTITSTCGIVKMTVSHKQVNQHWHCN